MATNRAIGGTLYFKHKGVMLKAKGAFTYNEGKPKKTGVMGADGFHGYTEEQQIAFIEGAITNDGSVKVSDITGIKDGNATLDLANGKTFVLRDSFYAGEGTTNTEQGELPMRLEGADGEEIAAAS